MSAGRTPPPADRRPVAIQTIGQGTLDHWVILGTRVPVWDQAGHAWHPHLSPGPRGGVLWSLEANEPSLGGSLPLDLVVMRHGPAAMFLGGAWVFVRWADGEVDRRIVVPLDPGER